MSANLITGNLFKPIYAYQDADYQAGISGNVTSIMPVGSQMALSIEDANTIKADDGVLITKEGRRIQIDAGAIEEWSIPTGTQGVTNYFIIGFHLYTDSNSAEVCETFVEQMENATDTIPEGTFREGSTEVYVSLGRVVQSGINLDSVTSLAQIAQSFEDIKNAITQLNSDLGSKSSASAVTGNDAFSKIATLNSDLTDVATSSQIGSGTKIFSISNTRKRLLCITKKSGVIVETKEIPTSVLESGDVVLLGNTSPVIGTETSAPSSTSYPLQENLVGKQLDAYSYLANNGVHTRLANFETSLDLEGSKSIGLAADLSSTTGASITYNGLNSFTITVTDSTLSVYVY